MTWQQAVLAAVAWAFTVGCAGSEEISPRGRMGGVAFGFALVAVIASMP
jgi:hypothetical protein